MDMEELWSMTGKQGGKGSDLPWNAIRVDRSKCLYAANAIFSQLEFWNNKDASKSGFWGDRASDCLHAGGKSRVSEASGSKR